VPTHQLRAIWHPARARIYELLISRPATNAQIVEILGGSLAKVAYHSRVLCQSGCAQVSPSPGQNPDEPLYEAV
jgi:hypothetical protein